MPKEPGKSKSALRRQRLKLENPDALKKENEKAKDRQRKVMTAKKALWDTGTRAGELDRAQYLDHRGEIDFLDHYLEMKTLYSFLSSLLTLFIHSFRTSEHVK